MEVVALLPMKAHSSRVPNKNFRMMGDKPLYRWILDALLATPAVSRVVINTDAQAQLEDTGLTSSDRVIVRTRTQEICGDEVSMNRIIENDLEAIGEGHYLMTHTTNPAISTATLARAIAEYERALSEGYDSLFTVNRHQTRFYTAEGEPINHDPDNLIPTQDLEPWFEENSCMYLFSRDSFQQTNARIGTKPKLFETPPLESVDIDEPEDWRLASILLTGSAES